MAATITLFVGIVLVVAMLLATRQVADARKAKTIMTTNKEYSQLAEEYRKLSEMAVTAQEHTDLKLADIVARIEGLRDQLDSVQRILKDVE
jgi:uncharacterized protein HemX